MNVDQPLQADSDADQSEVRGPARLGVVLVNWNGGDITIECLESLLRSDIPLRVVVVDNDSADDSVARIRAWASGETPYAVPDSPLAHLTDPPLPKPLLLTELTGEESTRQPPVPEALEGGSLTLIASGGNLGFAGGNNVGIRHLLLDPDISAVWLLNNDTVVEPGAARAVLKTVESDLKMGMVGTVVRYYNRPETVQVLNGLTFNLWTGMGQGIGGGLPVSQRVSPADVAKRTDFVLGASFCVSRRFVQTVGLMSERYFLYYEEIDWATRNRGRFRTGFARGAQVYHKHGGAIGSSSTKGGRSAMSDYWMLRSRLKFYRTHYPVLLPLIWAQGVAQTGVRLLRRQPSKAVAMTKALLGRDLQ